MAYSAKIDALSKSECQILSYKHDTVFKHICYVNKAPVLLLFTYALYWFKF